MYPVQKALWFIESHFNQDLTLDDIAEVGGVSRFYMSRVFVVVTAEGLQMESGQFARVAPTHDLREGIDAWLARRKSSYDGSWTSLAAPGAAKESRDKPTRLIDGDGE